MSWISYHISPTWIQPLKEKLPLLSFFFWEGKTVQTLLWFQSSGSTHWGFQTKLWQNAPQLSSQIFWRQNFRGHKSEFSRMIHLASCELLKICLLNWSLSYHLCGWCRICPSAVWFHSKPTYNIVGSLLEQIPWESMRLSITSQILEGFLGRLWVIIASYKAFPPVARVIGKKEKGSLKRVEV